MNSAIQSSLLRRAAIPTVLAWSFLATAGEVRLITTTDVAPEKSAGLDTAKTRDTYQRDYSPGFLADRLGITQKSAKLTGTVLRDKDGDKLAKMQDIILDLGAGQIVCVLVSGDSGSSIPVPPASFRSADECGAMLNVAKSSLSDAPRVPAGADLDAVFNSLPQACGYFNQPFNRLAKGASPQSCRASSLIGLRVKNPADEQLGSVVNLMVDVPTARVIYAVISFAGGAADLYAVPMTLLRLTPDHSGLLLDTSKTKIADLAHSDSFFWANLGDVCWGVDNYKAFGLKAEFDAGTGSKSSDPNHELVRAKVDASPASPKCDSDLQRDILMAMMHDDINNGMIYKNVKIGAAKGQIILTGRVKNEKQRTKLLSIVTGVVGAANVQDQIQVK